MYNSKRIRTVTIKYIYSNILIIYKDLIALNLYLTSHIALVVYFYLSDCQSLTSRISVDKTVEILNVSLHG